MINECITPRPSGQWFISTMKEIKQALTTKFNELGCKNYKILIAEEAGLTVQRVRKFFAEEDWANPRIKDAAFKVLQRETKRYEAELRQLQEI